MLQQQVVILNNILLVLDAICMIVAGFIAYYWSYASSGVIPIETNAFYLALLSMMFINSYMADGLVCTATFGTAAILALLGR